MGKAYEIKQEELKELQEARKNTKDKREEKRIYAVELRAQGLNLNEISEKLDVVRVTISKWTAVYKKEGIQGLLNKKRQGNRRNLSIEQEKGFLEKYEEAANKGHIITVQDIEKEYKKLVGHEISSGQIYKLLKRHGFRKVMPRSKHPKKANEEVIETSKKLKIWQKN